MEMAVLLFFLLLKHFDINPLFLQIIQRFV